MAENEQQTEKKKRKKGGKRKKAERSKGDLVRFPLSYIEPALKEKLVKAAEKAGVSTAQYTHDLIEKAVG